MFAKRALVVSILLIWVYQSYGQTKYEREFRLKQELVPGKALAFVEACDFTSKVKWYGEESFSGESVEAKVKHLGHLYSIEFDTLGNIQDVEIRVGWNEIDPVPQKEIEVQLLQLFSSYKFKEIQVQWTGKRTDLIAKIRAEETEGPITTKYEIVVKAKTGPEVEWYEILFSDLGQVERKSVIVSGNTDNLEY